MPDAFIFYVFEPHIGQNTTNSTSSTKKNKPRKKLQKARKNGYLSIYSCGQVPLLMQAARGSPEASVKQIPVSPGGSPSPTRIRFSVDSVDDGITTRIATNCRGTHQPHHIAHFLKKTQPLNKERLPNYSSSVHSLDSLSIYSVDDMESTSCNRRTRPKTPCFWIGQLDRKFESDTESFDPTAILADEYQDELPPRNFTPFPDSGRLRTRKLRRSKGQASLRELVTCHRFSMISMDSDSSTSSSNSDSETLVGTPSTHQPSPTSDRFSFCKPEVSEVSEVSEVENITPPKSPTKDENIGFQICLDLLTNELATALYKQHPAEGLEKASGLQILLMIEAYEAVQQQIRQDPHVSVHAAHMMDNWLMALYKLYDERIASKIAPPEYRIEGRYSPVLPTKSMDRNSKRSSKKGSADLGIFKFEFEDELQAWGARDIRCS